MTKPPDYLIQAPVIKRWPLLKKLSDAFRVIRLTTTKTAYVARYQHTLSYDRHRRYRFDLNTEVHGFATFCNAEKGIEKTSANTDRLYYKHVMLVTVDCDAPVCYLTSVRL